LNSYADIRKKKEDVHKRLASKAKEPVTGEEKERKGAFTSPVSKERELQPLPIHQYGKKNASEDPEPDV